MKVKTSLITTNQAHTRSVIYKVYKVPGNVIADYVLMKSKPYQQIIHANW